MLARMRFPLDMAPWELDRYLARGWFRMRQTMFTTNFIYIRENFYSVLWLRVRLRDYRPAKSERELLKLNTRFRTEIQPCTLSVEQDQLFKLYRKTVNFDLEGGMMDVLYGPHYYNPFDTWEVNIYDGDLLIACGFFDLGRTAAAGIVSFYHPDYRKYSLGKMIILKKIAHCQSLGLEYFYPGYLVPGYKAFDYKASIGRQYLEYLQLASGKWLPYIDENIGLHPLQMMVTKLTELKLLLDEAGVPCELRYYRFFDGGLEPSFFEEDLFDFPVFIYSFSPMDYYTMVVYDVRDGRYHLLQCKSLQDLAADEGKQHVFSDAVLGIDRRVFATAAAAEMVEIFPAYI